MQTHFENLTGFKKYATAFFLGALMTLSMPPLGFFPLLLVCVPGFIWLTRTAPTSFKAFLTAWTFGCGYFIFGLYWISAALFVDIAQWKWVLPLSLVAGPALLALFWGVIPVLARQSRELDINYALSIVAMWTGIEWLRGTILTGFPWNLPGYTWNHVLPLMQVSAFTGIYGLTMLTLFWAALPVYYRHNKLACFSLALFILLGTVGTARVYMNPVEQNGTHSVRIVQANIPQTLKWARDEEWRNIDKHVKLSAGDKAKTSFIVWPETAIPADLKIFPDIAQYVSMNFGDAVGLIGNQRVVMNEEKNRLEPYNSLTAVTHKGEVLDVYDKFHLVPFGEYIPFRDYLSMTPISLAIANLGDFIPGGGNRTLKFKDRPSVSPLICYEAIFPHAAVDQNDRSEWIVNVTNDGWYGRTAGPFQHFEITRVRAVEEGLPLARAANTGISAMIDPVGRVLAKADLGETAFVDAILPKPLSRTLYSILGDWIFFGLLFGLIFAAHLRFSADKN